jgi:hypothetical protein
MSRLYSLGSWIFTSVAITLAVLVPLTVPETAFADTGDVQCTLQCYKSCSSQCAPGDQTCQNNCLAACAGQCCVQQCNGDSSCQSTCCQLYCGSDINCMQGCLAGGNPCGGRCNVDPPPGVQWCCNTCPARNNADCGAAGGCNAVGNCNCACQNSMGAGTPCGCY